MEKLNKEESISVEKMKKLNKRENTITKLGTLGGMTFWNVFLFILPLIYLVVLSFSQRKGFGIIDYSFTIENYAAIFSPTYINVFIDSLKMAFIVTILASLLAYPYAYFVSRKDVKKQSLLILLVMIPSWTNSLLRVFALQSLMSTNGIINSILYKLHIISAPIQMLSTDFAVYFGMIFVTLPFMILPLYANMQKIDSSLLEAGRDLGASGFQLFWEVIFPISLPGLASGIIMVFLPSMANFFITDLLGGGKSINLGNVVQNQFTTSNNWPLGAAVSILLMVICCIVIMYCDKFAAAKAHGKAGK